jgi:hypothetical protein
MLEPKVKLRLEWCHKRNDPGIPYAVTVGHSLLIAVVNNYDDVPEIEIEIKIPVEFLRTLDALQEMAREESLYASDYKITWYGHFRYDDEVNFSVLSLSNGVKGIVISKEDLHCAFTLSELLDGDLSTAWAGNKYADAVDVFYQTDL